VKKFFSICFLFLGVALGAQAQTQAASDTLYQALGQKAGITALVDDFVGRVLRDDRIKHHFKDTNPKALKDSLSDQFCQLSGGPCKYEGADMKAAHADMGIRKHEFNALVEDLQVAMDARGIPFAQQNRLLVLLAPMHRDIITER
jgi:hemoglobin